MANKMESDPYGLCQEYHKWKSGKVTMADLLPDNDHTAILVRGVNGMIPDRVARIYLSVIICKNNDGTKPAEKLYLDFQDPEINGTVDNITMDNHLMDGVGLMAFGTIMNKYKAKQVPSDRLGNDVIQDHKGGWCLAGKSTGLQVLTAGPALWETKVALESLMDELEGQSVTLGQVVDRIHSKWDTTPTNLVPTLFGTSAIMGNTSAASIERCHGKLHPAVKILASAIASVSAQGDLKRSANAVSVKVGLPPRPYEDGLPPDGLPPRSHLKRPATSTALVATTKKQRYPSALAAARMNLSTMDPSLRSILLGGDSPSALLPGGDSPSALLGRNSPIPPVASAAPTHHLPSPLLGHAATGHAPSGHAPSGHMDLGLSGTTMPGTTEFDTASAFATAQAFGSYKARTELLSAQSQKNEEQLQYERDQAAKNLAEQQRLYKEQLAREEKHAKDKEEQFQRERELLERERELTKELAAAKASASAKAPTPEVAELSVKVDSIFKLQKDTHNVACATDKLLRTGSTPGPNRKTPASAASVTFASEDEHHSPNRPILLSNRLGSSAGKENAPNKMVRLVVALSLWLFLCR